MSDSAKSMGRSAALVSIFTMLSRLLGLVREQAFAALFGAGAASDAYQVAFRIPNLLRDLLAEGALSSAFLPVFTQSLATEGKEDAYRLGNRVAGNLLVITVILGLLGFLFAPDLVSLMAGGFHEQPDKYKLTVLLTQILLPFLSFISLAAVAMGMLNAQEKFGVPAFAPALFNLVSIACAFGLWGMHTGQRWTAIGWAIGSLLGGFLQLTVQLPSLWREGWRPAFITDLRLRDPRMKRIALTMAPAMLSVAAVQLNVFINTSFASEQDGAVTWLSAAFRFLQLPIGVFGVAIATVAATKFSQAAAKQDGDGLTAAATQGLKLVFFLTVPATVGLFVLSEPIIRLIYQHGRFDAADTTATAGALQYYSVGLVAYAAVKVFAPAFYAMRTPRFAVYASLAAVAANVAANVLFYKSYGFRFLAFGTALAALVNFSLLYVLFNRKVGLLPHREILKYALVIVFASAMMGAAVYGSHYLIDSYIGHTRTIIRLFEVFVPVAIGGAVYVVVCQLCNVQELQQITGKLMRRFRR